MGSASIDDLIFRQPGKLRPVFLKNVGSVVQVSTFENIDTLLLEAIHEICAEPALAGREEVRAVPCDSTHPIPDQLPCRLIEMLRIFVDNRLRLDPRAHSGRKDLPLQLLYARADINLGDGVDRLEFSEALEHEIGKVECCLFVFRGEVDFTGRDVQHLPNLNHVEGFGRPGDVLPWIHFHVPVLNTGMLLTVPVTPGAERNERLRLFRQILANYFFSVCIEGRNLSDAGGNQALPDFEHSAKTEARPCIRLNPMRFEPKADFGVILCESEELGKRPHAVSFVFHLRISFYRLMWPTCIFATYSCKSA